MTMTKAIAGILLSSLAVLSAHAGGYDRELEESRNTAREFMGALKQALMESMQDGGPVNAVSVCNLKAPAIANTYSVRDGWNVARTSLKLRNPANAPDVWERKVLESFEKRHAAGEDPKSMEYHEVLTVDGSRELRYMKAIPTADLCLVCHGEHVDSLVKERLGKLYPEDQATGFRTGDIRGAFTITRDLTPGTD